MTDSEAKNNSLRSYFRLWVWCSVFWMFSVVLVTRIQTETGYKLDNELLNLSFWLWKVLAPPIFVGAACSLIGWIISKFRRQESK